MKQRLFTKSLEAALANGTPLNEFSSEAKHNIQGGAGSLAVTLVCALEPSIPEFFLGKGAIPATAVVGIWGLGLLVMGSSQRNILEAATSEQINDSQVELDSPPVVPVASYGLGMDVSDVHVISKPTSVEELPKYMPPAGAIEATVIAER